MAKIILPSPPAPFTPALVIILEAGISILLSLTHILSDTFHLPTYIVFPMEFFILL